MELGLQHNWGIDPGSGRKLQDSLSKKIIRYSGALAPRIIAGVDLSEKRSSRTGRAAIVVLDWPSMKIIDLSVAEGKIDFPYIPGLLSFREAPLIIEAWKGLKIQPDITIFDGQGIAHPRRLGIASHLGLLLNIVSIGCAKSRLIGEHDDVSDKRNNYSLLRDKDEIIGAVVRTRQSVKPVYVSIGHRIDLTQSIDWVLKCCRGLRLPEPTRLAHQAAGGYLNNYLTDRKIRI